MTEPTARVGRPPRSLNEVKVQAGVAKAALATGSSFGTTTAAVVIIAVQDGLGDRAVLSGLAVLLAIAGVTLVTAAVMVWDAFRRRA